MIAATTVSTYEFRFCRSVSRFKTSSCTTLARSRTLSSSSI